MYREIWNRILLVVLIFILTSGMSLSNGYAKDKNKATEKKQIVVATKADMTSNVNPGQMKQVAFLVYQGLITLDPDLRDVPCLATSWEPSGDGKKWLFRLRQGVRFHDGSIFDSNDVKVTFNKLLEDKSNIWACRYMERVECPDRHTVEFHFSQPNFLFPTLLTYYGAAIISETAFDKGKIVKCVGTGPFSLQSWEKENRIVLKAHDEYWDGRPLLDEVIFKIIPDPEVAVTALEAGEIDMTLLFQAVAHAQRIKRNPKLRLLSKVGDVNYMLAMNITKAPFDDLKVRQAINYAIEKTETIPSLFGDAAEPQDYMFCTIWDKFRSESAPCYRYNQEKAKMLLSEAGWKDSDGDGILEKDGKKFEFGIAYRSIASDHARLGQAIQYQLARIGIKARLEPMESAALSSASKAKKLDSHLTGQWANIFHEPKPVYIYYYKNGGPFDFWHSDETDMLIDSLDKTPDLSKRIQIHHRIQEKMMGDAPVAYLYNEKYIIAKKREIKGFEVCSEYWHMFCKLNQTYFED